MCRSAQAEIERDIEAAKSAGALRLLLETVGSAEIVLCETLQRIDAAHAAPDPDGTTAVTLSNWHGYSRPECRAFDEALATFRQTKPDILFIPCAKTRPTPPPQRTAASSPPPPPASIRRSATSS